MLNGSFNHLRYHFLRLFFILVILATNKFLSQRLCIP